MQMVFFTMANMVVMYMVGNADRDDFISIAADAPVPFLGIIGIGLFMGLLSGSFIREQKYHMIWSLIHVASAFLPLVVGLHSLYPLVLTVGVAVVFLLAQQLAALLPKGSEKESQIEVL